MKSRLEAIRSRWAKATPGPWTFGGPVARKLLLNEAGNQITQGLTSEVYEIGHAVDRIPPGIAVVNDYFLPSGTTGHGAEQRWSAKDNASAIAHAPEDVAWLIAEVEHLRKQVAKRSSAR